MYVICDIHELQKMLAANLGWLWTLC